MRCKACNSITDNLDLCDECTKLSVSGTFPPIAKSKEAAQTSLHEAIEQGNLDFIISSIQNGTDVNAVNHKGLSLLYKAVENALSGNVTRLQSYTDIVLLLIRNGARVSPSILQFSEGNVSHRDKGSVLEILRKEYASKNDGWVPYFLYKPLIGDLIKWKEYIWAAPSRKGEAAQKIGEQIITARIEKNDHFFLHLLVKDAAVVHLDIGQTASKPIEIGKVIRRKLSTLKLTVVFRKFS